MSRQPLLLLFVILCSSPVAAPAEKVQNTGSASGSANQEMHMVMPLYAPFFIEGQNYSSTLTMVNSLTLTVHATVIARNADGFTIGQQVVTFPPHSQQIVQLRDILKSAGLIEATGSVEVVPNPMEVQTMAIGAQLSIVSTKQFPLNYFEEELLAPDPMQSTEYRAVAPSATESPFIALLNTADTRETLTVTCLEADRNSTRQTYDIAAAQLMTVHACGHGGEPEAATVMPAPETGESASSDGHAMGIDISTTGGMGTFAVWGIANTHYTRSHGNMSLNFTNSAAVNSPSTIFAGVPLGVTDLLGSEKFTSDLAVANFGVKPASVYVSLSTMSAGSPQSMIVATSNLSPGTVQLVRLPNLGGDPGIRNSFSVTSDSVPGAVISNLVARGQSLYPVVQLIGKDAQDLNNGGGHPWSIANGYTSTLLLFNHAPNPVVFSVSIGVAGMTWYQDYNVAPNETSALDLRNIIINRIPDLHGKKLPTNAKSGEVSWFTLERGEGTGRLLVSNSGAGLARNFSCGDYVVLCGSYMGTTTATFPIGGTGGLGPIYGNMCTAFTSSSCSGQSNCSGCGSGYYNWASLNTSVATVSGSAIQPGATFYGNAAGSATAQGQIFNTSCSFISSGTVNVQKPTASRITQTISNAANSCPTGSAGWKRVVYKIVTDQNQRDIVVGGQSLTEQVTVPQANGFGIPGAITGIGVTNAQGLFSDTFSVCTNVCPGSNQSVTATQTISDSLYNNNYILTQNSLVYSCTSITVNGQ